MSDAADRCPGALRVHQAADGGLARIRLPGGRITPAQLRELAECAKDHGAGVLELTSRGNVQVRGIPGRAHAARLAARLAGAGLLPTPTHERVRNIVASPLSGHDQYHDIRGLVTELDEAVRSTPELAGLSGRWLFALDSGRGDVATLGADLCWHAGHGALLLGGLPVRVADPVTAMVAAAEAFLRLGADLWRLTDLPDGPARVAEALGAEVALITVATPADPAPPVGPYGAGLVVAAARLGRLTAAQAGLIADLAADTVVEGEEGAGVVVTPWRSAVLPTRRTDRLAAAGLIVDPASPWIGVTACTGRPGCASALADVLADAEPTPGGPVHWAGCERRCGKPRGPVTVMLATPAGYRRAPA